MIGVGSGHDSDGRFAGSNRVNVEDVPRLPTFPAAWTLSDPRGRPYFVSFPGGLTRGDLDPVVAPLGGSRTLHCFAA